MQQLAPRVPDGEELSAIIPIFAFPAPPEIRPGPRFPDVSHSGLPEAHFETHFGSREGSSRTTVMCNLSSANVFVACRGSFFDA